VNYPDLLAAIKAQDVPAAVIWMHLKHGLKKSQTCGACYAYLTKDEHSFCGRSWSLDKLPPSTLACGKFQLNETKDLTE
jgi:hypothetical protein